MLRRPSLAALLLVLASMAGGGARAEDEPLTYRPPVMSGIPLDGMLDEIPPRPASAFAVAPLEVPDGRGGTYRLEPEVYVVVVDGALRVAVKAKEPAGLGIGLAMMVAEDGTTSAADAVAVSYAPQDPRVPRIDVRGPNGVGRGVYRVEAAAAVRFEDHWGVEVQVPLSDLGLSSPRARLRLALAIRTRAPQILSWVPARAAFQGPPTWIVLEPPAGGWPVTAAGGLPGDLLLKEDEADARRVGAWQRFLVANAKSVDQLVREAKIEGGALAATDEQILRVLRHALVRPLERASDHRPDLAMLHVVRGHVLRLLGLDEDAREAYGRAMKIVPGLPEARYGRWVGLEGPGNTVKPNGGPTRYESYLDLARSPVVSRLAPGFTRDGRRLTLGLLLHLHGEFEEAATLLDDLAERYPFSQQVVFAAERNRAAKEWTARELSYRESDAKKGTLPKARLETSKGVIVLELFENDAANTVDNFAWLARHDFYDDANVSTVPFFAVRVAEDKDPGYAIPTELPKTEAWRPGARRDVRRRRPFRGTVALLSPGRDAGAGGLVLFTGSAFHVQDEYVAFGRVVEGLEVLDALTGEDRILDVTVEGAGSKAPITVEGTPAPAPKGGR